MRILYVNTPVYDYLTATLVEGLLALGHELRATESSNYATAIPDAEVASFAESADLIVVGSNRDIRLDLVRRIGSDRIVHVDGSDLQILQPPPGIRFKAIFKRELGRTFPNPAARRLHPLPFAAERRYFSPAPLAKDIAVSFVANLWGNPLRYSVHQRLANLGDPRVVTGVTGERAYDGASPVPIETPVYRQILHRSRIGISVPGNGYDCARFWEILAAGALLLTWEPDIVIPEGFTDGVDCVTFRSLDEFEQKLAWCLAHPERVDEIAARGRDRLLRHHTTDRRAAAFLATARHDLEREGYWGP